MKKSPVASLSLDLDNLWSYLKTHGDPDWESSTSYLDLVVPRFLEVLDRCGLKMTVFVVGRDAASPENRSALRAIAGAGHEFGNHSFRHEPWLHLYRPEDIETEIALAETAIEDATGVRPKGFRGPGYSLSADVLEVLVERGYDYDCSTFPTFVGPLARAYYFLNARLSKQERERRKKLFGNMREGLRPLAPYQWRIGDSQLLEIPVTTIPIIRAPFHFSYLHWLAQFGDWVADAYFRTALTTCRLRRIEPSLLLHPLDFLGSDDVSALSFFPAMQQTGDAKMRRIERWLGRFAAEFDVFPMGEYGKSLNGKELAIRQPDFPDKDAVLAPDSPRQTAEGS